MTPATAQGLLDLPGPGLAPPGEIEAEDAAAISQVLDEGEAWPAGALCLTGDCPDTLAILARRWQAGAAGRLWLAAGDTSDSALFSALSEAERGQRRVLLTADSAPMAWPVTLPDLRSRLSAVPVVALPWPGPQRLGALVARHAARVRLALTPAQIGWALARLPARTPVARALVAALLEEVGLSARPGRAALKAALDRLTGDGGICHGFAALDAPELPYQDPE